MTSEDDLKIATKDNVARASQAGHETRNAGSDTFDTASSASGDITDRARAKVSDMVGALPNNSDDVFGAIRSGGDEVARRVNRQPVEALLLAGAIGYLVGWAINLT